MSAWVGLTTTCMVALVISTLPPGTTDDTNLTVSQAKPGCLFGITNDVNNCGLWAYWACASIGNPQPTTRNGRQCELCKIWQFQVQGRQTEIKEWRDCNNDGVADCEFWVAWAWPKCVSTGTTSVSDILSEGTECPMCPVDTEE